MSILSCKDITAIAFVEQLDIVSVIHDDTDRFDIFIKQYNPSTKTTLPLKEGCSRRPLNPLACVFSHKIRRAATFLKKYVTIMSLAERKKLLKSVLQNICYS